MELRRRGGHRRNPYTQDGEDAGGYLNGEPVYLVTGQLWEEVIHYYGLRFRIYSFHKDSKQNLGLEVCQLRSLKGTGRHWLLGIKSYSLLINGQ